MHRWSALGRHARSQQRRTRRPQRSYSNQRPSLWRLAKDKRTGREEAREAAEAAKKKAEEEKIARACCRELHPARQAKATLESGVLMKQTNAQASGVIMDEASRNAEIKRTNDIIASDCTR